MKQERSIIRGVTVFCDDIRQEVGGKLSFMGVYNSVLIPSSPPPVTLAKLCASISVRFYGDEPMPAKLTLRIHAPPEDEIIFSSEIDLPSAPSLDLLPVESVDSFWTLNFNAVFAPLELKGEGFIRVRADVDGVEWKLGALQVVRPQPQ